MRTERESSDLGVTTVSDRARMARALISEEVARIVPARYGNALRAVVLTGSVARDEATVVRRPRGWKVLGDAELYLVFHDRAPLPTPEAIAAVCEEVSKALAKRCLLIPIGFSPVDGPYFERMPRHILTYELRACGCVVWGDAAILDLIPAFTPAEMSLEDAWRLLANRIVEQLEAIVCKGQSDDPFSEEARYHTTKLYLDMATSYLVFVGHYRPTYRERAKALRDLATDGSTVSAAPFPLLPFAQLVSECTRFKLQVGDTDVKQGCWEDCVHFAHLLWKWELIRLTGAVNQGSDTDLMMRWMKQQPLKTKVRGWVSVFRRCGWFRSWRQWPRWIRLARRASPRYWVYTVATELFFQLPAAASANHTDFGRGADWKLLADRLPLADMADVQPEPQPRLAQLTAFNYHSLLESTIA